jgi:hypothetical protein
VVRSKLGGRVQKASRKGSFVMVAIVGSTGEAIETGQLGAKARQCCAGCVAGYIGTAAMPKSLVGSAGVLRLRAGNGRWIESDCLRHEEGIRVHVPRKTGAEEVRRVMTDDRAKGRIATGAKVGKEARSVPRELGAIVSGNRILLHSMMMWVTRVWCLRMIGDGFRLLRAR